VLWIALGLDVFVVAEERGQRRRTVAWAGTSSPGHRHRFPVFHVRNTSGKRVDRTTGCRLRASPWMYQIWDNAAVRPVMFHARARDEIRSLPKEVRFRVGRALMALQLGYPLGIPLSANAVRRSRGCRASRA
jgi:hypothetical protein